VLSRGWVPFGGAVLEAGFKYRRTSPRTSSIYSNQQTQNESFFEIVYAAGISTGSMLRSLQVSWNRRCMTAPTRLTYLRRPGSLRFSRLQVRHDFRQQRTFLNLPTVLVPPVVFVSLGLGLWTWKCFMMVVFQNKIIYMPGLPPNARRETIEDYKNQCGGIEWKEERIRSGDGTRISLCMASVDSGYDHSQKPSRIYILYFQGLFSILSYS
jgi:hypothetical protein